ncbi:DUF1553 domain-containing protein [Aeoliella sp.]|uniref:DUF1553 domain-containing protein n=1 Tax=Aeoliella sp. TaxID=2795800 RepID=UPI003CCBD591
MISGNKRASKGPGVVGATARVSLLALIGWLAGPVSATRADDKLDFNRDIRPILSDACFHCHGNDQSTREAELRLDLWESATAELPSGARAIVPGDLEASELVARITTDDGSRMPPEDSGKHLSAEQIELLKRWIAEGAEHREHYAFETIERPAVPDVTNQAWVANPIDAFVAARHEAMGLAPRPEADKQTLVRRVTLDLRGFGPTLAEASEFVEDDSPDDYEKLVDRLLGSQQFGEHKARYWLDLVRYADTHGMHLDNYREMWPYRDWVIQSINHNKPFDQFTIEQLAGDLLPNPTLEQQVGSGYNRCIVTTNEGGSIPEEVYVRNVVDLVNTTGTAFLGLTVGCAQCHDHKYDPLSQKEYFELFAFFNSIDSHAMDGNVKDHAPCVHVLSAEDKVCIAECRAKQDAARAEIDSLTEQRTKELEAWTRSFSKVDAPIPPTCNVSQTCDDLVTHLPLDEAEGLSLFDAVEEKSCGSITGVANWRPGRVGQALAVSKDTRVELESGIGAFKGKSSFSFGCWLRMASDDSGAILARIDEKRKLRGWEFGVERGRLYVSLIGSWPQYAIKVICQEDIQPDTWTHVFVTYDGKARAKGVRLFVNGRMQEVHTKVDSLNSKERPSIDNEKPMLIGRRGETKLLEDAQFDDVTLFDEELATYEVAALAQQPLVTSMLDSPANEWTEEDWEVLRQHYFATSDADAIELYEQIEEQENKIREIVHRSPSTLVSRELRFPRPAYLLNRGNYDQPGERVERKTPAILPPMDTSLPRNRLGFAKWLVDPEHPLTARVTVNRIWQEYFGTGLVKTSENFGLQGEPPSHPELLDWLAAEFIESGWDVKHIHRLIVTSSTYRQASAAPPEAFAADPDNRLLARGPRYRLDAEMLRDQALAVSGLMVDELGGPSVKPPQPDGLWHAVAYGGSNTARFKASKGDSAYRRSVYVFWKRTSPPPYFVLCDAPSREESFARRERTSSPLVALMLMNEPSYVRSANAFASAAWNHSSEPREQAAFLYQRATLSEPTEEKLDALETAYGKFLAKYEANPEDATKLLSQAGKELPLADGAPQPALAATTMLANVVLNLDEVLNKE